MDQIYSATYSGVEVYEFVTTTGSVMMRKSDGWVNATHILKTANFPKAKRTRILERDVQVGVHDKVQGGYGKYQGTYVPLERARSIAKEFGVDDILEPLFLAQTTYADSSPPPAPKHHHASKNNSLVVQDKPTGRKALLARKVASMPAVVSKSSAVAASAPKKRGRPKKLDAPVSNPNEGVFLGRRLNTSARQRDDTRSDTFDEEFGTDVDDMGMECETELNENDGLESDIDESTNIHLIGSPSSPSEFMSDADLANALKSPTQQVMSTARESLERAMHNHTDNLLRTEEWIDPNSEYTGRLLEYFMQPDDSTTESRVPDFLLHPPKSVNLDQPIDDEGHTAFHWACSMGNSQVVEALINLGANYRAVNNAGETSLMRIVQFTNSYSKRTFPRLVELLSENIFDLDSSYRSVLHHAAAAASSKARFESALYYMEIILAKLSESQPSRRLEEFINLQDSNGDTALHLCAQNANKKCIKLLLEYKAKGNIRNNHGRIASDILLDKENLTPRVQQRYAMHMKSKGMQFHLPTPANTTVSSSGGTSGVAAPHISEAAIDATHKVAQILIESLQELSNAYDHELQRKEADVAEVQELVANINDDIRSTQQRTRESLGEDLDEKQIAEKLKFIEDQVKRHETLVQIREAKLKKLLERSQRKSLDKLVKKFEATSNNGNGTDLIAQSVELSRLQVRRKRLVSQVMELYAEGGDLDDKMQKYRRLISASADIPIDDVSDKVDELLVEIEKAI